MKKPLIVLAFSGGLDTTFCLLWLKETFKADVVTVTVDTGGFSDVELAAIAKRAKDLGAKEHKTLDAKTELFERFAVKLVQGNVLRGRVYPLSVAAERVLQAELVAKAAKELKAAGVAHGSTGAGNDQVRFDGVLQALLPGVKVHAPIRELAWSRQQETDWLAKRGVVIAAKTTSYSINAGLWGTTIGGKETHDPWAEVPFAPIEAKGSEDVVIKFEKGVPVGGVKLVQKLHALGKSYGLGRGVHLGDTILGIKGRIAFEAPAPLMLIAAHQELEKLVLTRWQQFWKNHVADFYGQLLHEGLYFEPAMRDIEAMIESSQRQVTGEARLKLEPGRFAVTGVKSPFSLMSAGAKYGETTKLWTGDEAAGFSKLHALSASLAMKNEAVGEVLS
jgi:argininosuccinate synthase